MQSHFLKYLIITLFIPSITLFRVNPAFAATAQVNSVIQSGGGLGTVTTSVIPISDLSRRITLFFNNVSGGANTWAGAYKGGGTGTTQYQVPSGKNTYCFNLTTTQPSAGQALLFGYSTATFTNETSSAPTGEKYYGASSTSTQGLQFRLDSSGVWDSIPLFMEFDGTNYPFIKAQLGGTFHVYLDCMEI